MRTALIVLLALGVVLAVAGVARAGDQGAMPPAGKHFLGMKGTDGYYCTCGADCKCKMDEKDLSKCTCGKAIEKMEFKGKYVCKDCGSVSDKAGKCCCGKDLTKVE
jgi:hypothetical protein